VVLTNPAWGRHFQNEEDSGFETLTKGRKKRKKHTGEGEGEEIFDGGSFLLEKLDEILFRIRLNY